MIEIVDNGMFAVNISLNLFNVIKQRSLTQLPKNLTKNGYLKLKKFEH